MGVDKVVGYSDPGLSLDDAVRGLREMEDTAEDKKVHPFVLLRPDSVCLHYLISLNCARSIQGPHPGNEQGPMGKTRWAVHGVQEFHLSLVVVGAGHSR